MSGELLNGFIVLHRYPCPKHGDDELCADCANLHGTIEDEVTLEEALRQIAATHMKRGTETLK